MFNADEFTDPFERLNNLEQAYAEIWHRQASLEQLHREQGELLVSISENMKIWARAYERLNTRITRIENTLNHQRLER